MLAPSFQILLLEEDSSHQESVRSLLKASADPSFRVEHAEGFLVGLEWLTSMRWDALLLSLSLPDNAGLPAVREVHAHFRSLPIIAMVSKESEDLGKGALREGASEYLVKKRFTPELLHRVLRHAIASKEAEEALRQKEERNRELFDNAKDIFFTLDLDGYITEINRSGELALGCRRGDAVPLNINRLAVPEHAEMCKQMMQRVQRGILPAASYELHLVRGDGRRVCLEISSLVMYREGKKTGIQAIARDITERRQLENMLRQSQKMEAIGRLSGGLAHDFNNLLCVISGHAEMLADRTGMTGPFLRSVMQISKAADSAAALIRQLLAFSRQQVFHPQIVNLNETVLETQKLLGRLIGEQIDFVTNLDPILGNVLVDPIQIEQVLVNLFLNARDAMPQGGKLSIDTHNADLLENCDSRHGSVPPGRYVLLAIADSGCGMDEETQNRIFEPFYTTKELGKGNGLGLATVYGIVKQSGGFILVHSEPEQGTTFKIYLPREDRPVPSLLSVGWQRDSFRGTETVLLVEDSEPLRSLIQDFLQQSGHTVLAARNGREAIEIVRHSTFPIHLLLTDVVMPEMGGRQLAEQVTSMSPSTKVLYMSGYADHGIVQAGVVVPGVVLLEKPFSNEKLMRKVRQVLDESQ